VDGQAQQAGQLEGERIGVAVADAGDVEDEGYGEEHDGGDGEDAGTFFLMR
jgi:hypothetical protein